MKKIIMLLTIFTLTGCINQKKEISKTIELNLNKCNIEKSIDNHGGFLGDGDSFVKIKCEEVDKNELEKNWKKLPLSNNIKEVLEMEQCDDNECKNVFKRYEIPEIENGYYYFLDRHTDSKDKKDDTNLNNRSSYNFSIALYNSNEKIIYFYELDT